MADWLLKPPVAFIILLIASWIISLLLSNLALKTAKETTGKRKAYACGQDATGARIKPNYNQFFRYAFLFTLMHVAALILLTVPKGAIKTQAVPVIYIAGALVGILILFRRDA